MGDLSNHVSKWEVECHGEDCCGHSAPMNPVILNVVDRYRDWIDSAVYLSCGFRCLAYNRTIKDSSDTSQHPLGTAVDVKKTNFLSIDEMADWFEEQPEVGAVGRYHTFVHVDIRPRINGKVTTWDRR